LVVVPFTQPHSYNETASCANTGGGVQLLRWTNDTLAKAALLPLPGNPRRAIENGNELLTVSDSNVRAYSLADTSVAHVLADVTIDTCTPDTSGYYPGNPGNNNNNDNNNNEYGGGQAYPGACSAGTGSGTLVPTLGIALALVMRRRRRG
jgi:uncharacterized protein (TIGR03382 family)